MIKGSLVAIFKAKECYLITHIRVSHLLVFFYTILFVCDAPAQTAVCTDTPSAGERVECKEDDTSTDDIDILLEGVDIDVVATMANTPGVHAEHKGTGNIDIEVTGTLDESNQVIRSTIDTSGSHQSYAIYGHHEGTGTLDISVSDTTINTTGRQGIGVHGRHDGIGGIVLNVSESNIHTTGKDGIGVYANQANTSSNSDVLITVTSNRIETEGESAHGVRGDNYGSGDVTINSRSNTIITKGPHSAQGIYGYHRGDGDIFINSRYDTIDIEDSSTSGGTLGIWAWHQLGNGDAYINVHRGTITTKGFLAVGVTGWHGKTNYSPVSTRGLVSIELEDSIIETEGSYGFGIWATHTGIGDIRVVTRGSQRITTKGESGHGILAYHTGSGEDRSIEITMGGGN